MLEIFNKYGWPGIIVVFLSIGGYILAKYIKKQSEKKEKTMKDGFKSIAETITSNVADQNTHLVKVITDSQAELVNTIQKNNEKLIDYILSGNTVVHVNSLDQRMQVADSIETKLRDLRNQTDASRICVIEFHNSKENLTGLSFLWYDIHYERPAKGVPPITDKVRNVDATRLLPIVKRILLNDDIDAPIFLHENEIHELQDTIPLLYNDLKVILNLKHVAYAGIYDDNTNKIIGLLCVEYNEQHDIDDEEFNEFAPEISKSAREIGTLLTFSRNLDE